MRLLHKLLLGLPFAINIVLANDFILEFKNVPQKTRVETLCYTGDSLIIVSAESMELQPVELSLIEEIKPTRNEGLGLGILIGSMIVGGGVGVYSFHQSCDESCHKSGYAPLGYIFIGVTTAVIGELFGLVTSFIVTHTFPIYTGDGDFSKLKDYLCDDSVRVSIQNKKQPSEMLSQQGAEFYTEESLLNTKAKSGEDSLIAFVEPNQVNQPIQELTLNERVKKKQEEYEKYALENPAKLHLGLGYQFNNGDEDLRVTGEMGLDNPKYGKRMIIGAYGSYIKADPNVYDYYSLEDNQISLLAIGLMLKIRVEMIKNLNFAYELNAGYVAKLSSKKVEQDPNHITYKASDDPITFEAGMALGVFYELNDFIQVGLLPRIILGGGSFYCTSIFLNFNL